MSRRTKVSIYLLVAVLLAGLPFDGEAKSYSSGGGRSYSSHSSSSHSSSSSSRSSGSSSRSSSGSSTRSSNNSGGKSFNSGSGKSYSSGSKPSDSNRKGYSSSKSYTAGGGARPAPPKDRPPVASPTTRKEKTESARTTFDTAAARARKEEASREQFNQFKQSQQSSPALPNNTPRPASAGTPYADQRRVYIPNGETIRTRPVRIYNVYNSYRTRPWVTYHDPYHSFFWWWLLDRSLDDRAWWAYHHRYDMDPLRYQALMANDQQLQARVAQLEAQPVARDPGYVPAGIDRDLMYSDQYVDRGYSNRPTTGGAVAFWVLGVPLALGFCAFFIWLIWFKRWQTAT